MKLKSTRFSIQVPKVSPHGSSKELRIQMLRMGQGMLTAFGLAMLSTAPTTLSLSPVPIVAMWCSTMVLLRRRGINGPLSWRSWINTEAGRGLWKPGNPRIQWVQLTLSKHRLAPPEFGYAVGLRIPSHSAITP